MDDEKRQQWAEFRFKVIAPLVCRRLDRDEHREVKSRVLSVAHLTPDGDQRFVAERTLRTWVARYNNHGLEGLLRLTPTSKGKYTAISEEVLNLAEELRRERPERSINTILSLLRAQTVDVSGISRSTLNYHLNLRGAKKEKHASEKGTFQPFQKEHANDLWQADASGGLWLPDPLNRARTKMTRFISFIDDSTRVVTHAQFYFDEQLPSLLDCFRKGLLSHGKPGTIYCDNGSVYRSKAFASTCARLGIELIHAQEYCPEGKGKVERHIGTVKAGFYGEAKHCGLSSLDELNTFFFAWLEAEYHNHEHRSLKMTPHARWQQDEGNGMIELVTSADIRQALMLREKRSVNRRTATVTLNNRLYRVAKELAGEKVEVRWDADKLVPEVEIWHRGKLVEVARELIPGRDIDFSQRPARERDSGPPLVLASSKKLQKALVSSYQRTPFSSEGFLAESEFQSLTAELLNRELSVEEKEFLSNIYHQLSPFSDTVTRETITKAVAAKGEKLHVRYYCDQLRQAIYMQRSN